MRKGKPFPAGSVLKTAAMIRDGGFFLRIYTFRQHFLPHWLNSVQKQPFRFLSVILDDGRKQHFTTKRLGFPYYRVTSHVNREKDHEIQSLHQVLRGRPRVDDHFPPNGRLQQRRWLRIHRSIQYRVTRAQRSLDAEHGVQSCFADDLRGDDRHLDQ